MSEQHSPTVCDYTPGVYPLTGPCSWSSPCPGPDVPPERHGAGCWHRHFPGQPRPDVEPTACRGGASCPHRPDQFDQFDQFERIATMSVQELIE